MVLLGEVGGDEGREFLWEARLMVAVHRQGRDVVVAVVIIIVVISDDFFRFLLLVVDRCW